MSTISIVLGTLCLFIFAFQDEGSSACGHTVLYKPTPWNPIHCRPPKCPGPVPPQWSYKSFKPKNSVTRPGAIWKRGEHVKIQWHRNNHGGGFVRFSLVPLSQMTDHRWHEYTAFHYGCFEAYRYSCSGSVACGNDNKGKGYYQYVEIPRVFPDGMYVFGMVWFGGVKYDRVKPEFPNFFSASFVEIRGGLSRSPYYRPRFVPVKSSYDGTLGPPVPFGTCLTTSNWVGECDDGRPCWGRKAAFSIPGVFKRGRKPELIFGKELVKVL